MLWFIMGVFLFLIGLVGIDNFYIYEYLLPPILSSVFVIASTASVIFGLTQFIAYFEIAILILIRPAAVWAKR